MPERSSLFPCGETRSLREETLRLMTLRPYVHSRGEKVAMHWVDEDGFSDCGLYAEEWFIPTEAQVVCRACDPGV